MASAEDDGSNNDIKEINDISDASSDIEDDAGDKKLTKNQKKKLERRERYAQLRPLIRQKQREKRKRRYEDAREQGISMGPSRKSLKKQRMIDSPCKMKVVVDCSFDDYMTDKDIIRLTNQIQRCYSINRRAPEPFQLYFTSINGKTLERLKFIGDYTGWDVNLESKHYLNLIEKDQVVYLSSDSPNILTTLEEDKAYIIGGLVDHNQHKGLCHRLAEEKGIAHAQLPISEYLDMKTRKVLTIDHVFDIMYNFRITKNWEEAFFKVLPKRKGAVAKQQDNNDNSSDISNDTSSASGKQTLIDGDSSIDTKEKQNDNINKNNDEKS